jgi:hypothetical protein
MGIEPVKHVAPKAAPDQVFCVVLAESHNGYFPDQYFGPFVDQLAARDFCNTKNSVDYKCTVIHVKKV